MNWDSVGMKTNSKTKSLKKESPGFYGFGIVATENKPSRLRMINAWISGLALEAGKFRTRLPFRPGDYVPVWGTKQEAKAVMSALQRKTDDFTLDTIDIAHSWTLFYERSLENFQGMDGFEIPHQRRGSTNS